MKVWENLCQYQVMYLVSALYMNMLAEMIQR